MESISNAIQISDRIKELYSTLKGYGKNPQEIAVKINDILIYGEKVPRQILISAWEMFAKNAGVIQ